MFALTIGLCGSPLWVYSAMCGVDFVQFCWGQSLLALGFLCLFEADSYAAFLVYEVVLGVGYSLISGADLALLYDNRGLFAGERLARRRRRGKVPQAD